MTLNNVDQVLELENMDMHELLIINDVMACVRVPNGWLYTTEYPNNSGFATVFVPEKLN